MLLDGRFMFSLSLVLFSLSPSVSANATHSTPPALLMVNPALQSDTTTSTSGNSSDTTLALTSILPSTGGSTQSVSSPSDSVCNLHFFSITLDEYITNKMEFGAEIIFQCACRDCSKLQLLPTEEQALGSAEKQKFYKVTIKDVEDQKIYQCQCDGGESSEIKISNYLRRIDNDLSCSKTNTTCVPMSQLMLPPQSDHCSESTRFFSEGHLLEENLKLTLKTGNDTITFYGRFKVRQKYQKIVVSEGDCNNWDSAKCFSRQCSSTGSWTVIKGNCKEGWRVDTLSNNAVPNLIKCTFYSSGEAGEGRIQFRFEIYRETHFGTDPPPTQPMTTTEKSFKLEAWIYVLIALGGVFLIMVVVLAIVLIWRKRREKKEFLKSLYNPASQPRTEPTDPTSVSAPVVLDYPLIRDISENSMHLPSAPESAQNTAATQDNKLISNTQTPSSDADIITDSEKRQIRQEQRRQKKIGAQESQEKSKLKEKKSKIAAGRTMSKSAPQARNSQYIDLT